MTREEMDADHPIRVLEGRIESLKARMTASTKEIARLNGEIAEQESCLKQDANRLAAVRSALQKLNEE